MRCKYSINNPAIAVFCHPAVAHVLHRIPSSGIWPLAVREPSGFFWNIRGGRQFPRLHSASSAIVSMTSLNAHNAFNRTNSFPRQRQMGSGVTELLQRRQQRQCFQTMVTNQRPQVELPAVARSATLQQIDATWTTPSKSSCSFSPVTTRRVCWFFPAERISASARKLRSMRDIVARRHDATLRCAG